MFASIIITILLFFPDPHICEFAKNDRVVLHHSGGKSQ